MSTLVDVAQAVTDFLVANGYAAERIPFPEYQRESISDLTVDVSVNPEGSYTLQGRNTDWRRDLRININILLPLLEGETELQLVDAVTQHQQDIAELVKNERFANLRIHEMMTVPMGFDQMYVRTGHVAAAALVLLFREV